MKLNSCLAGHKNLELVMKYCLNLAWTSITWKGIKVAKPKQAY